MLTRNEIPYDLRTIPNTWTAHLSYSDRKSGILFADGAQRPGKASHDSGASLKNTCSTLETVRIRVLQNKHNVAYFDAILTDLSQLKSRRFVQALLRTPCSGGP